MDVSDFRKEFIEEVKTTVATVGDGSSACFVNIAARYLIDAEVLPDYNPSFHVGVGKNNRRIRVDGYALDEFDYTMYLIIASYSGYAEPETLNKSSAVSIFDRLIYFVEEAYGDKLPGNIEISNPAADLVDLLRFYKNKIRKYRLFLITDSSMSDRIETLPSKSIEGVTAEFQIWDIDRIFRICLSDLGRQNIEINFKAYTDRGIPCLNASESGGSEYKSYLCIIPGKALADIYDNFGSQLLEGNVRSFLSTKVAVNKKIRETIISKPTMFFAFNNGISATAIDLAIEHHPDGSFITYAKDFQIINGGQTTASLSNARHRDKVDLTPIYVQMKLTEIDENSDSDSLIRNISRSSNSQNKVSDADFFSTHPFHVRMEQISRKLFAPTKGGMQFETKWFYERARGQYLQEQMRMTKSEKEKFVIQHPKSQLITKTDLAKIRNTWDGMPQIVSRGAQTNFMKYAEIIDEEWSDSDLRFNERYYQESVALMILFRTTESLITNQPWYEQGYRANIVTYSLALLHKKISNQFLDQDLDLMLIWNRQEVPEIITNELIKITKLVFDSITDDNRETINVTQWCKRDACWNKIKSKDYQISENIRKVLIDKLDIKTAEKDAKKDQKFISDVEAQAKVLEFGSIFWKQVYEYVIFKKLGSPESLQSLKIAMQIPVKLPNSHQSLKLLELLDKAYSEGFKIS